MKHLLFDIDCTSVILQGGCRQRSCARDYRRNTVVWKPDKSSSAPAFSCFRWPILSLKRLSLDEAKGQVVYQYGKNSTESEHMDYLEFIARVTSHIPDKVYEVDPLLCPKGGGQMSIISFIEDHKVIDKIIFHLKLTFMAQRPLPSQVVQQELLKNFCYCFLSI
ncbi:MAG: hypothetical protein MUP98_21380 [Candidatus Aminicenantes bacterium]|nr:hypothetical protein [Candidatus Aminicenantes bacterium]